jgi:hypothetical protein
VLISEFLAAVSHVSIFPDLSGLGAMSGKKNTGLART